MDTENHSFPTPQPGAKPKLEPGPLQKLKLLKKKKKKKVVPGRGE